MTIEERTTKGKVIYFRSITYDPATQTLIMEISGDPESDAVNRKLTFRQVTRFDEDWYDRDDACLEMLIGLDEYPAVNRYVIRTDQREIILVTDAEPDVVEIRDMTTG